MATNNKDRPCFREHVASLAGHGAWRESGASSDASHTRALPSDQIIAAALAFV